jgi:hypothetical protein
VGLLNRGIGVLLTAWQPYVLVAVGLTAILFTQLLPASNSADSVSVR